MAAGLLALSSRQFATVVLSIMKNIQPRGPLSALQSSLVYFFFLSERSGRRRPPAERSALYQLQSKHHSSSSNDYSSSSSPGSITYKAIDKRMCRRSPYHTEDRKSGVISLEQAVPRFVSHPHRGFILLTCDSLCAGIVLRFTY